MKCVARSTHTHTARYRGHHDNQTTTANFLQSSFVCAALQLYVLRVPWKTIVCGSPLLRSPQAAHAVPPDAAITPAAAPASWRSGN